ncbi:MAG: haloacid dehalogenase type II [Rhizobiaceae bacterium]|nr:haloacid dehalogenase type II [Rhizobiaceae bacterium]
MKLTDFEILTFDVYGTLIDWESGMISNLQSLTKKAEKKLGRQLSRDEILEAHAFHESTLQRFTPAKVYSDILATVYKRLGEQWEVKFTHEQCVAYGHSVPSWPPFPDSVKALQYLGQHYALAVLSNIDNLSFSASNKRLEIEFDAAFTAEDIGSYKPDLRNFDYMLEILAARGIDKSKILHTAESLFHDHVPAKKHGLANCWIYRRHEQQGFGATRDPGTMPMIDFKFNSMAELADAHRKELAQ